MDDPISRRAAIDAICDNCNNIQAVCAHYPCKQYIAIEKLPSAQPEQKKGKWIPHIEESREYIGTAVVGIIYDYWFCDTCGYRVEDGRPLYNFCPNCGNAKEIQYGSN